MTWKQHLHPGSSIVLQHGGPHVFFFLTSDVLSSNISILISMFSGACHQTTNTAHHEFPKFNTAYKITSSLEILRQRCLLAFDNEVRVPDRRRKNEHGVVILRVLQGRRAKNIKATLDSSDLTVQEHIHTCASSIWNDGYIFFTVHETIFLECVRNNLFSKINQKRFPVEERVPIRFNVVSGKLRGTLFTPFVSLVLFPQKMYDWISG